MAFTKQPKPTITWTPVALPTTIPIALFDVALFDQSEFDETSPVITYTKVAKPTAAYTKVAKPTD